ncbi:hypothetical protein ATANTOWER_032439 [Ataeniobius toweri]|uniref:Uncharacterized protein n=1 Tax=Ataeniobius toweri TaxID=208326 RepID=A0ABU7A8P8_9TELE|nr:hypothetical protein [Ataeniobius toweri]
MEYKGKHHTGTSTTSKQTPSFLLSMVKASTPDRIIHLYSPTTSSSQLSESLFSPATPTGCNLRSYHPLSPDLYSPLCMAESVHTDIRAEDKRVVVEDEASISYSPCPQTTDPIPDPQPSPEDESNLGDEIDGWISTALINTVKTAILHLFNITCLNYLKETCYGCITNHPSQQQHQCLEILEEEYYQINFQRIVQRLINPNLLPAI